MSFVCYILAMVVPTIGDAISIVGFTINPLVGFIFPCLYYLKLNDNLSNLNKGIAYFTIFFITGVSIYGLVDFIIGKING